MNYLGSLLLLASFVFFLIAMAFHIKYRMLWNEERAFLCRELDHLASERDKWHEMYVNLRSDVIDGEEWKQR